ncbi:MAG TPA: LamG-like jellyroll fold domain-containing protein [Planctomycetota bacterium]
MTEFDVLCEKYFAAELTPEEREAFLASLREQPELRRKFLRESIRLGAIHEWAAEQAVAAPKRRLWPVAVAAALLVGIATLLLLKPTPPPKEVVAGESNGSFRPPPLPPKPEPEPEPEPEKKPEPRPEPKPEPRPEPRPEPKPAPKPEPRPEPKPEPPGVPAPKPPPPPRPVTEAMVAVVEEGARKGAELPAGATLEGFAVFVFPDKTRIALGADTEIRDLRSEGGKRMTLVRGVLAVDVAPQLQPLKIETSHGTATALGTSFTIRAERFRLEVVEGKVRMESGARSVVVGKDQAVEADFALKRIPAPDLTTELVGYWKFDETGPRALDVSPYRHHATVEGAVRVKGKAGLAARFDGVDDFIRLPSSKTLDELQDGDYTMAAWCLPNPVPRGGRFVLMGKVGFHLGLVVDDEARYEMWHYLAAGPEAHARSAPGRAVSEFAHLAGVVSRAQGLTRIYVNGRLEGQARWEPGAAPRDYGGRGWTIGMAREAGVNHGAASATLDEVLLYRRALTPRDVAALAGALYAAAQRVR